MAGQTRPGLQRLLIKKGRFIAQTIKDGDELALVKKEAFHGAKDLKMA